MSIQPIFCHLVRVSSSKEFESTSHIEKPIWLSFNSHGHFVWETSINTLYTVLYIEPCFDWNQCILIRQTHNFTPKECPQRPMYWDPQRSMWFLLDHFLVSVVRTCIKGGNFAGEEGYRVAHRHMTPIWCGKRSICLINQ